MYSVICKNMVTIVSQRKLLFEKARRLKIMSIPRPEHPMPQWERENWLNLNGTWEFEFDFGLSAIDRQLWKKEK